ncbi:MoaD/ThiS family protein [Halalkalicoccus subterraneus]|uniref:MoaD/ThiS family protein n=1 Tax=Halalkalicoccus subterraneus TaxID=2675002 RepID=UPI000EFC63FF
MNYLTNIKFRGRTMDHNGELRNRINILQNGKNVYTEDSDLVSKIKDSDELALFPPVSGGSFSLRI